MTLVDLMCRLVLRWRVNISEAWSNGGARILKVRLMKRPGHNGEVVHLRKQSIDLKNKKKTGPQLSV